MCFARVAAQVLREALRVRLFEMDTVARYTPTRVQNVSNPASERAWVAQFRSMLRPDQCRAGSLLMTLPFDEVRFVGDGVDRCV
jgi:hypothetical protein